MKISTPYIIRITGSPDAYIKCPRSKANLWHSLDRLFSGEDVAESEFQSWGLNVTLVDEFVKVPRIEE